jgi:hypothetical protein
MQCIASWVPLVLAAALPASGHADRAGGTLVVDDTEVPLGAVSAVRAVSVDTIAVHWLSYVRGTRPHPVPDSSRPPSSIVVSCLIERVRLLRNGNTRRSTERNDSSSDVSDSTWSLLARLPG